MRFALLSAAALPVLASAHGVREIHARQQAAAPPPSGTPSATTATGSAAAGTTPAAPATTPTLTFTLASTNPSAIPLSEISAGAPSQPTVPASTTFAAGTKPTAFSNAPALPDLSTLSPANYPTLDKTPDINSPEVQQWIKEVADSGVDIPDIAINAPGGCPANPQAVANKSNGWWTCGGDPADDDVSECPDKMTWGLTYDDGPALYTGNLLSYLDQADLKATFFVVGSRAISYPALLQEEYMAGHQIAVHTWSHPQLTTLKNEEIIAELGWTKKIIKDVLGVTPTFYRPPYGDVDNRVRAIARAMGLKTSIWTRISATATFDTGDFDINGGLTTSTQVLNNWQNIIGNASTIDTGFIVLEHDLFQQTVDIAIDYILPDALAHQPPFKIEPIISCLGQPMGNAYIETNDNKTNPIIPSGSGSGNSGGAQATGSGSSGADANNGARGSMIAPGAVAAMAIGLVSGAAAVLL